MRNRWKNDHSRLDLIMKLITLIKTQIMSIEIKRFNEIVLTDRFFDSLKADYPGFEAWYDKKSKAAEQVFVQLSSGNLQGFLYMKIETEELDDITPPMPAMKRLKVGTFKIDAHNTKLGERFVKKIVDKAVYEDVSEIYVTIFEKHEGLINLLQRYGFVKYGTKGDGLTPELVFVKKMNDVSGDLLLDFPLIQTTGKRKFVLSIKPEYHTKLFPDSMLVNEHGDKAALVKDVSHTNSIHKVYLCFINGTEFLKRGDLLLLYRTNDGLGPAYYRSVCTSVCVVEEIKRPNDFLTEADFIQYTNAYSIFGVDDLKRWYKMPKSVVIRMTYNAALYKRVTRGEMIEMGISTDQYWGFFQLTDEQFEKILKKGVINESLIVD